jgi:hypothetical protein
VTHPTWPATSRACWLASSRTVGRRHCRS